MEENKIKIFNEDAMIEGDSIPTHKKQKTNSYIMITVSFFVLMIACVFSEIGYSTIGNFKKTSSTEMKVEGSYAVNIIKSFLGIEEIHKLEKIKDVFGNMDEPSKENEQIETALPIETDTEVQSQTQTREPLLEEETDVKYPVVSLDLSQNQLGENYIVNETGYTPDIEKLRNTSNISESLRIEDKSLPSVLIIHTHGTESYLEDDKDYYTEIDGEISRTNDKSKNMVSIGKIIADVLNEGGINTLHCEVLHDEESYQDSYTRASESIKSYLAKYPSIKYVFDVHRDAILKSDGSLVKATTTIGGESVAQVMTVVGSDYKGANFPNWENNLSAALRLKKILDDETPLISRPIYLRGAAYNQQYAPCSLLLEIGTSGNTLSEAKKAAEIVAESIIKLLEDLSIEH